MTWTLILGHYSWLLNFTHGLTIKNWDFTIVSGHHTFRMVDFTKISHKIVVGITTGWLDERGHITCNVKIRYIYISSYIYVSSYIYILYIYIILYIIYIYIYVYLYLYYLHYIYIYIICTNIQYIHHIHIYIDCIRPTVWTVWGI